MKKLLLVLVLAIIATGGAFAQLSVGGGLLFDYSLGNGQDGTIMGSGDSFKVDRNNMSVGGFVFFDAQYVKVDISFAYGQIDNILSIGDQETLYLGNLMQLGFDIIGKYPIPLGKVSLFPMLGLGYNLVLSSDMETLVNINEIAFVEDDKPTEWSQFGLLAGIGADFWLTESLFIRAEALANIRLPPQRFIDAMDNPGYGSIGNTIGIGPRIKLGIGYKF